MTAAAGILVVGGGAVGLTAALALKRALGAEITLIDSGVAPRFDAGDDIGVRVSAISLGSMEILADLGVWEDVRSERACPYRSMRVWDSLSSVENADALVFDAADFALPELGCIVENELLRQRLHDQCAESDVHLRYETSIAELRPRGADDGFSITLQSGERFDPELLVGADGGRSYVRRSAGIPSKSWRYPQSAFVTHVRSEYEHQHTAWQRFLPGGPMALLPLSDGRSSVVWSAPSEQVAESAAWSAKELGRALTEASDGVLGQLTLDGERASFPLRAQHAVRYVRTGLALIGDAAHSVHPLAGQGANLGFADVKALRDVLAKARAVGEQPGDLPTLRAYERARRGPNAVMLHFIDGINRLFATSSGPLKGLRRQGMRLFNRSGPLRRRAVQVALGINV